MFDCFGLMIAFGFCLLALDYVVVLD